MSNIKAFYSGNCKHRTDVRSGIVVYPLPKDECICDHIKKELNSIRIQTFIFAFKNRDSVLDWCKSVEIKPIDTNSLLVIWTYKTHPETCIRNVQKIVRQHEEGDRNE